MFGRPNKEIIMYKLISIINTKGKSIATSVKPEELKLTSDNGHSLESILRYAKTFEYEAYVGDDSIMLINFDHWDIKVRIYNKIKGY